MTERTRVAVIGSTGRGNYGHGLDTAWFDVPATEIVAVADDNKDGLARAAKKLKVDQAFVRDITTDPDDAAIVSTIVTMAHNLNMGVIAEGVETEAQASFLREARCEVMQGFLFGRPLPAGEMTQYLLDEMTRLNSGVSKKSSA